MRGFEVLSGMKPNINILANNIRIDEFNADALARDGRERKTIRN